MRTKPRGAPGLTPAQDLRRMEGLRMLARVIARHYLEHPELYPPGIDAGDGDSWAKGSEGADGDAARKEATE